MDAIESWLDGPPPEDPSRAEAYWCEMDYFLAHTSTGDYVPCTCREGMGHNAKEASADEPR